MSNAPPIQPRPRTLGETWVWLCGMALATCLCMILGLLLLIITKGLSVFWPSPVMEITYTDSGGATEQVAAVVLEKGKPVRGQIPFDPAGVPGDLEYRFFTGNREAKGDSFLYLRKSQIQRMEPAEGVWVGERYLFGQAIFYPERLLADGALIAEAGDPQFKPELRKILREVKQRAREIRMVEKIQIGRINRKLDRLARRERALVRRAGAGEAIDPERLEAIETEREELERAYSVFESEARALRALQEGPVFQYRLLDGTLREVPLMHFANFFQPNEMSVPEKVGHYLNRLWRFLSEPPREANTSGGIFPAIFGTFVMTVLMSAAVVPFGVLAAVYLREYASHGPLVQLVRISVLNLAGVPSIVFGVFGLAFFVYFVGGSIDALFFADQLPTATFGTGGILWASLTLAIMTVPVVIVATEEALASVPEGMREASLACGASKWQTTYRVVLPASVPGILTGLILAMARGAGEVAPLMLVGVVKLAPSLPIDGEPPFFHLDRKFMHLGFHIYDLGFQSPNAEATLPLLYATAVFLILLILTLNLGAILLRNHLRKKSVSGTF